MARWPRGEDVKVGLRRAVIVETLEVRFGKDFVGYGNFLECMSCVRVVEKFTTNAVFRRDRSSYTKENALWVACFTPR
jgi:hypothetical protein